MSNDSISMIVDLFVQDGFDEKPLRAVQVVADDFDAAVAKIRASKDYTAEGKANAIRREAAKAQDRLAPMRSKIGAAKTAADAARDKALAEWGADVDPADVREQRMLIREQKLSPVDVGGRLGAAVRRGDKAFTLAVEQSMTTEFPLTSQDWVDLANEEKLADLPTDVKTLDAAEAVVVEVEKLVGDAATRYGGA